MNKSLQSLSQNDNSASFSAARDDASGAEGTLNLLRRLLAAAIILPIALLGFASSYDWNRLKGQATERSAQTADLLREHALKAFQIHDLVLDHLDDKLKGLSWDEIRASEQLHRDMKKMIEGVPQISTLLTLDPEGRLSTNSRQHPPNPLNNSDRAYYQVPRSGQTATFIDEPVVGRVSGQPILNISRPRSSPDGNFNGVLTIATFLEHFSDFYRQHDPARTDSVSLIRSDGVVLVRHPSASVPRVSPDSGLMQRITAGQTEGTFEASSTLDQVTRIFSFRKVGPYPIYVTYGLGLDSVRQEWLEGVAIHAAFTTITIAGLLGFILLAMRQAKSGAQALAALRVETAARSAAESAYEALYTQTPLPLHSVDSQGNIVGISDRWAEFMGYGRDDVLGRHVTEFMTAESRQRYLDHCWPRLLSDGAFQDEELQFVRKSGKTADMLVSARVTYDAQGRFLRTFTVLVDITDRKTAQLALTQAQKMEALGNLTGGVAHDFNNLLQGIYGCFRAVLRRSDDPGLRRVAEAGQHAVERGARLTRQLTAFARRQPLRPEPRDVAALIRDMQELLRRSLPENITLAFALPRDLWPAMVDATELELAVLNIAVNAKDALREGGTFKLEAQNVSIAAGQDSDGLTGDFIELKLADDGPGMSADVRQHAFEPFYSTKGVGKGSGLGLAMVYGFCKQSGGTARIESREGEGTTITLLLPRSQQLPVAERPDDGPTVTPGEGVVLVVDDDPAVGESTLSLCSELGYSALRASSAAEALSLLVAGPKIDIVITDLVMPGQSGLSLADEIDIRWPGTRIVLATGYSDATLNPSRRKWPLLKKPFTLSDLSAVLTSGSGERRAAKTVEST